MKGSPILSTLIGIVIMLAAYLTVHSRLELLAHKPTVITVEEGAGSDLATAPVSAFLELHFSSPPTSLVISDPILDKPISTITNLTDLEWSGDIWLPNRSDFSQLELSVKAKWDNTSEQQHFILLTLSPDGADDASVTLRSMDSIDTTATFIWNP